MQNQLQNVTDILRVKFKTADKRHGHMIFCLQLIRQCDRAFRCGIGGVEDHGKGLADGFELLDDAFLCLHIAFARDLTDGTVGAHKHAYGGVLIDDLFSPHFRRFHKGDRLLSPWGAHHPRLAVLNGSQRLGNDVADAVHHFDAHSHTSVKMDLHRFVGDKFGFGGHDRLARRALGHFVPRPLSSIGVADVGKHHCLHESLDESGFSASHGPHHSHINIASRTGGDVPIDAVFCHKKGPPLIFLIDSCSIQ